MVAPWGGGSCCRAAHTNHTAHRGRNKMDPDESSTTTHQPERSKSAEPRNPPEPWHDPRARLPRLPLQRQNSVTFSNRTSPIKSDAGFIPDVSRRPPSRARTPLQSQAQNKTSSNLPPSPTKTPEPPQNTAKTPRNNSPSKTPRENLVSFPLQPMTPIHIVPKTPSKKKTNPGVEYVVDETIRNMYQRVKYFDSIKIHFFSSD